MSVCADHWTHLWSPSARAVDEPTVIPRALSAALVPCGRLGIQRAQQLRSRPASTRHYPQSTGLIMITIKFHHLKQKVSER